MEGARFKSIKELAMAVSELMKKGGSEEEIRELIVDNIDLFSEEQRARILGPIALGIFEEEEEYLKSEVSTKETLAKLFEEASQAEKLAKSVEDIQKLQ